MTLILGLLNHQQAILVSDRRFTVDGNLQDIADDEKNKSAVFVCEDARMAVGFTGLAGAGSFETATTMLDVLLDAGKPDHSFSRAIHRFASAMGKKIERIGLRASSRRLTFVFAGYHFDGRGAHAEICQVTNWDGGSSGSQFHVASKFYVFWGKEPLGLFTFGACAGVAPEDQSELRGMLSNAKPSEAIIDKAVHTIRKAADSGKSGGLIGKQCMSIVIPADPSMRVHADYHSSSVSSRSFLPNYVESRKELSVAFRDVCIQRLDREGRPAPLAWPRVGRNQPCPCGSGKKFKRCHGRTANK